MPNARIRYEGAEVIVTLNGHETRMPFDAALQIAQALMSAGRAAEEIANREQIVIDQAILLRAGVPLGLTNHPALQAEAAKAAAWDSTLRRQMPGGVRSSEQFGTPTIRRHRPRREGA